MLFSASNMHIVHLDEYSERMIQSVFIDNWFNIIQSYSGAFDFIIYNYKCEKYNF